MHDCRSATCSATCVELDSFRNFEMLFSWDLYFIRGDDVTSTLTFFSFQTTAILPMSQRAASRDFASSCIASSQRFDSISRGLWTPSPARARAVLISFFPLLPLVERRSGASCLPQAAAYSCATILIESRTVQCLQEHDLNFHMIY